MPARFTAGGGGGDESAPVAEFTGASSGSIAPDSIPYGLPAIEGVTYGDSVLDEPWFWGAVAVLLYVVFVRGD